MRNRKLIADVVLRERAAGRRRSRDRESGQRDGKTYIVDQRLREAADGLFGDLLREIQRIKSDGRLSRPVKALVETYGVQVDPALHKEVLAPLCEDCIAGTVHAGFVNPVYKPVMENGEIVDVLIEYTDDYPGQMMRVLRELFVPAVGQLIGRSDSGLIGNLFACGRTGNGSPSARLLSVCRQSCCRPFSRFGRCDRISSVPVRL